MLPGQTVEMALPMNKGELAFDQRKQAVNSVINEAASLNQDNQGFPEPSRYKSGPQHLSGLSTVRAGEKAYFGWSDVSFKLSAKAVGKSSKDPRILKSQQGSASPGEVIAIMGASGCGKTSLLNVLSGRIVSMNGHEVSGRFTINGSDVRPEKLGSKVAFVTQEDTLCPTATPREALDLSARLRLPPTVTSEERKKMVEETIEVLRLGKCADTMIGDEMIKGISGGEKRRTSIGIELITSPSILFLDEPTSGLDSFGAYVVVNILKDLARSGCTVLCTIHQPSSEVFHLFDRVLLLVQGRTLYDGGVNSLSAHLAMLGYAVPDETNPADHVMFLMQTLEPERLTSLCDAYEQNRGKVDPHEMPADAAVAAGQDSGVLQRQQAGILTQFLALGKREVQNLVRDRGALVARFGVAMMLNLLFGLLFLRVGDTSRSDYAIGSHFGALVMVGVSGMMGAAQPVLLMFPSERPRFVREYATGTYGATAYFLSKLVTELPLTFITSLLSFLVCYWMMDLHGNFFLLVITTWLVGLSSSSTALFFGCLSANAQEAMNAAPAVFVPQILFAGLFVKIEQIPVWIRWAQYLCSLKFGINLFLIIEYTNGEGACVTDQEIRACDGLLSSTNVDRSIWWGYALILIALFLAFRLAGLLILTRKARGFALA